MEWINRYEKADGQPPVAWSWLCTRLFLSEYTLDPVLYPRFTIGAATTGAYHASLRIMNEDDDAVIQNFSNLSKATSSRQLCSGCWCWLSLLFGIGYLAVLSIFASQPHHDCGCFHHADLYRFPGAAYGPVFVSLTELVL